LAGEIVELDGPDGFYEAPWVLRRDGTYYMLYDWKVPGSDCTPSNYQACVAYATAEDPAGPWTFQDIVLGGTSATTVHPSLVELGDSWYLTYHTKDSEGGGHFRRSVAIDEVTWDGPERADLGRGSGSGAQREPRPVRAAVRLLHRDPADAGGCAERRPCRDSDAAAGPVGKLPK